MKLMYHWTINFSFEKIFPLKQQFQCAANRDFANGAAGPFNVIVFFFCLFHFRTHASIQSFSLNIRKRNTATNEKNK